MNMWAWPITIGVFLLPPNGRRRRLIPNRVGRWRGLLAV
jgi:hypothetical protein